ncbi:Transcriptional regulatory protein LiaR [Pelotomaculum sp. FP]|uniref:response regulator transcription factor n=1 Tax=Pelotomaculum sp. FP TaxID=261474 RepID=UPI0010658B4B|nr:LuxR C-terminal-related transcriptional regulator [Pelotomaculum sp. FP]TEB10602.1 Transcriptional regulatory protein LiaR [Pelotomaculum sp. FP]
MSKCNLTPREIEIVKNIANGDRNKDIARKLYISEKTVRNHITDIHYKLSLENRVQVAAYAFRNRLVDI